MMFDLLKYRDNVAAIADDGRHFSYAELHADSCHIAERLSPDGLVFCLCRNSYAALAGYVGLLNKHIPTVLLDAAKDSSMMQSLIECYSPAYIWMPAETKLDAGECILNFQEYVLVRTAFGRYPINPKLLLLLTTSGSTGSPKLVRITENNLLSNAQSIIEYLGIDQNERAVTSLPMHYSYGMSVINSHLLAGAALLLTDKPVIQKPFWEFVKSERATSIAGVPYTYEMLRRLRFMEMDLPDLKVMTQAGGKLKAEIAREFIQKAKEQGKKFIVMYGQTEASPRMSYLPFDRALEKYSSIGIPIPGGRMYVIGDDGKEIEEPGIDGELVYEGPNVCMGYAERKEDLIKGDENKGRLRTGDIAHKDADGYFYITGRMKRFVKVWGNRCNLDTLEQLVKNICTSCACVGVDDKITIFVTENGLESKIKEYLCDKTGLNIRAFDVRMLEKIPTKDSGKIDYQQLQRSI